MSISTNFDVVASIPRDCMFRIFSLLQPRDIARCSGACLSWHQQATDPLLWNLVIPKLFFSQEMTIAKYFNNKGVPSIDHLTEFAEKFFNDLKPSECGELTCVFFQLKPSINIAKKFFPYYLDKWSITAKFTSGNTVLNQIPDHKEYCIFYNQLNSTPQAEMKTIHTQKDSGQANATEGHKKYWEITVECGSSNRAFTICKEISKIFVNKCAAMDQMLVPFVSNQGTPFLNFPPNPQNPN
jgi:hypothetical protein